jgi:hypothetical protein
MAYQSESNELRGECRRPPDQLTDEPTRGYYLMTLRIQAFPLVESRDFFENRRTELRHTKPYPIAYSLICICDFCKGNFINHVYVIFVKFRLFKFPNVWMDKKYTIFLFNSGVFFLVLYKTNR